jgi:hypothetical protein
MVGYPAYKLHDTGGFLVRIYLFTILAGVLLLGCCCDPDFRERSPYGCIEGTIQDSSMHQLLPGATVRLVGTMIGAVTNPDGFYRVTKVPAGTYSLVFACVPYHSRSVDSVVVRAHGTTRVNVRMLQRPEMKRVIKAHSN